MGKKVLNIPQHSLAAAGVTASYVVVPNPVTSAGPIEHSLRQPLFSNFTNGYVQFSIDGGVSDAFVLAPGTSFIDDATSNSQHRNQTEDGPMVAKHSVIMVKQSTLFAWPGSATGAVIVSGFYEDGD